MVKARATKTDHTVLLRIVDANMNRAKEGLRVCEDICRYIWGRRELTRAFKDLRHDLTAVMGEAVIQKALACRNIGGDVGTGTSVSETRRADVPSVFWANAQRVKESLRVLEEITKLIDVKTSAGIKNIRYRFYALEQKSLT